VPHISLVFREMWDTTNLHERCLSGSECAGQKLWYPTSRENERDTPNFLHTALEKTACAPFFKERRMRFAEPTELLRKSGMWGTPIRWQDRVRASFYSALRVIEGSTCAARHAGTQQAIADTVVRSAITKR
jgi:hypothetical protein